MKLSNRTWKADASPPFREPGEHLQHKSSSASVEPDVAGLLPGVYLLRVWTGESILVKKIIVEE